MSVLLGIDIGTTSTKAVLLDPEDGVVAEAERESRLESRQATWAEEDPNLWWSNVCEIARELVPGHEITCVGVTGMVPCAVLTDAHGESLRPSIQQNDARASEEIAELRSMLPADAILKRTGSAITQQSIAPKLMWLARHEPEVYRQAKLVQGSYDFIITRLTAAPGVEDNWAVESGLYDLTTRSWATDVLSAAGVEASVLPDVRRPTDIAGRVTDDAAAATGLPAGVRVAGGAADHVAAAFAAGLLEDGQMLIKIGGAGDILMSSSTPLFDERLFLDLHVIPGMYMPNGCMATSGSLLRWFQHELADGQPLVALDAAAASIAPGSEGITALPYFLGEKTPINDPDARGAFVGMHLGHTRAHMYRALLEAVAFGFRHHVEVFAELDLPTRHVRVGEGGARSALWTQIIADVIKLPVEVISSMAGAALGAAFVAGKAVGVFARWDEVRRFIGPTHTVDPQPNAAYERGYRIYRELYPALKEVIE